MQTFVLAILVATQPAPDLSRPTGVPLGEYFQIQIDPQDKIVPWYSPDFGVAFDHMLGALWSYWRQIPEVLPGVPHYFIYRTRDNESANLGVGGDQFAMMLSSWGLYYAYTGDTRLITDMRRQADHYLANSLSGPSAAWPGLPFPCNLGRYARYDGDLVFGPGVTQPDKAGSFALELVKLYHLTGHRPYLNAAVRIADVLAGKTITGDQDHSPLPFRVHADSGQVASNKYGTQAYTTNWTPTLRLFAALAVLHIGDGNLHRAAATKISAWLHTYPVRTLRWGPFFEDIPMDSNTQVNALTLADYVLDQGPAWGPTWKEDARAALDWTFKTLASDKWKRWGVEPVGEQTVYRVPGNSHTARQAATELHYAARTGDWSRRESAARQLAWATYMVGPRGDNEYIENDIWYTDGYGDFVRHYLNAMAADPSLAPGEGDHLLGSSSFVREITYAPGRVAYKTIDRSSREVLRLGFTPRRITVDGRTLPRHESREALEQGEGWTYSAAPDPAGVVRIHHTRGAAVVISARP